MVVEGEIAKLTEGKTTVESSISEAKEKVTSLISAQEEKAKTTADLELGVADIQAQIQEIESGATKTEGNGDSGSEVEVLPEIQELQI